MKKLLKEFALWINLLFLVEIEAQAFEVLVILKNAFEPNEYRFDQEELSRKQLDGLFSGDKNLKKLLANDQNELKSIWDIIGFLREKDYIEHSSISGNKITSNGLIKVNELESIVFSSKRILSFVGLLGGIAYSVKLLLDLIMVIVNIKIGS
jgi:hypothetical protein